MTETALACYVYCIAPADDVPLLEGLAGVDPAFEVERLTQGELTAVFSRVRTEEFGSEPLKRNLEDLVWLERTARTHERVLA
ncbi:MAG TPA: GvpL/GvpF family gas vesicle protein, partial [Solirubrobacteraceae bacterium]|nr:GvpL/GvpF family gas vesicle protein [Solirubrobacteraceae bacterium]